MKPVRIESVAHGGDGLARVDGKAVFVHGAIPGDLVAIEVSVDRAKYAKAVVADVIEPSPDRIEAPCSVFGVCGGCSWQQAPIGLQRAWKQATVQSQLEHIGRIDAVDIRPILGPGEPYRYRNRMDFRTRAGRPTLFAARSHDQVAISDCHLLAEPLAAVFETMIDINVPGTMTLRGGQRTGEVVLIVEDEAVDPLRQQHLPAASADEAVITEEVAGRRFRISGRSFFQSNSAAADSIVALAADAAGDVGGLHVVDAYAGVGLFAAIVGAGADRVTLIEADPTAVDDLRFNLGDDVLVIGDRVERGLELVPDGPDVLIVDPPRTGLGADVVGSIVGLSPRVVVSVSCDPATFARDARALVDAGYELDWVAPVDMFPQTPHIETVSRFARV